MEKLTEFLEQRRQQDRLRSLSPVEGRDPGRCRMDGRELVDLSSNDYLGLSAHPRLQQAARVAVHEKGTGSGASRLMSGDLQLHHRLEKRTADLKGTEAALAFNSGYQANTGLIPALAGRHDAIFADRLSHASIVDGALLSRADLHRFRHNDPAHLQQLLERKRSGARDALVVTESVFSMDGDLAPLDELADMAERYSCTLVVDEAHATGVYGPGGAGRVEAEGLTNRTAVIMGTYSKALGGFGAYVAGRRTLVDYLVNSARSFIYSTALPPAVTAANLAAVELCLDGLDRGEELLDRAAWFRGELDRQGWQIKGHSQIVPLVVGDSREALRLGRELRERGFLTVPVRPPTVPEGQARLRLSLSWAHDPTDLEALTEALDELR